jgi:N-acetylglucosaminyldiphosphoundecaprenol N-acetyl-beta-D-mannosaminyltransferase
MSMDFPRTLGRVLDIPIDALEWYDVLERIQYWSVKGESRYVCICNVHSIVTASQDEEFARVIERADLATPDGAPVAWMLRRLGFAGQQRINGPDLMWRYCQLAARNSQAIFLYGNTEHALRRLKDRLYGEFPGLHIAGTLAPPFRQLSEAEDREIVDEINNSGAGVVFVSLGCPKQEKWMAEHRGRINAVMIGVGAAFDYHAGLTRRAPSWMQNSGLEWLHRLMSEPKRLWRRYLVTNSLFVMGAVRQLVQRR